MSESKSGEMALFLVSRLVLELNLLKQYVKPLDLVEFDSKLNNILIQKLGVDKDWGIHGTCNTTYYNLGESEIWK